MRILLVFFLYFILSNAWIQAPLLKGGLTLNPYNVTPLSAIYRLNQTNQLPLTVSVKGKTENLTISHTYPALYGQEFAIHGFYSDYTNTLVIQLGEDTILDTNIIIGDVYAQDKEEYTNVTNPSILVHKNNNRFDPWNQDVYFLYDNYTNVTAYDGRGELRYLYKTPMRLLSRIELTNNELAFLFVDKKIKQVSLLGQEKLLSPVLAHHEFVYKKTKKLPNKIALTISPRGGLEDRITEVDDSGAIVRDLLVGDVFRNVIPKEKWYVLSNTVFDTNNLQTNRITQKEKVIDWAHINSLVYDEDNDILYLSLRHLGVLAVDYQNWTLLWWLAHPKLKTQIGSGYGEVPPNFVYLSQIEELKPYKLTSTTYPKNQHGLLLKSNGNLLMFDNNGDEAHNFNGSRVLEYQINNDDKTAKLIRQYKHPIKVYSRILSDIDLIGENWLILWGFDNPKTRFRITRLSEVDTKNRLIMDMSIRRDWVYRVEKKPLYPYQDTNKQYSIDVLEKDFL